MPGGPALSTETEQKPDSRHGRRRFLGAERLGGYAALARVCDRWDRLSLVDAGAAREPSAGQHRDGHRHRAVDVAGTAWSETSGRRCSPCHDELVDRACSPFDGRRSGFTGDGFSYVFDDAGAAVSAAARTVQDIDAGPWPDGAAVRLRIGLHAGQVHESAGAFSGVTIHEAARVAALAGTGRVLISERGPQLARCTTTAPPDRRPRSARGPGPAWSDPLVQRRAGGPGRRRSWASRWRHRVERSCSGAARRSTPCDRSSTTPGSCPWWVPAASARRGWRPSCTARTPGTPC